ALLTRHLSIPYVCQSSGRGIAGDRRREIEMVTLLRPTGRACKTTDQLIGTVKLHWPGADTARTPGVRALGPTDQAIPARYLDMSADELDGRIARARATLGQDAVVLG